MYGRTTQLPKATYKPGDRATIERPAHGAPWPSKPGQKVKMETIEVEVVELRHAPYWQLQSDGGYKAEPAIYLVRVAATDEEFHASERGMERVGRKAMLTGN